MPGFLFSCLLGLPFNDANGHDLVALDDPVDHRHIAFADLPEDRVAAVRVW